MSLKSQFTCKLLSTNQSHLRTHKILWNAMYYMVKNSSAIPSSFFLLLGFPFVLDTNVIVYNVQALTLKLGVFTRIQIENTLKQSTIHHSLCIIKLMWEYKIFHSWFPHNVKTFFPCQTRHSVLEAHLPNSGLSCPPLPICHPGLNRLLGLQEYS